MFVKVIVTPEARKEKLEQKGDTFVLHVREPASGNLANTRIRELIAMHFGAPIGRVRILTGHRSRVKMISISG